MLFCSLFYRPGLRLPARSNSAGYLAQIAMPSSRHVSDSRWRLIWVSVALNTIFVGFLTVYAGQVGTTFTAQCQ